MSTIKDTIAFVVNLPDSAAIAIQQYAKSEKKTLKILLIQDVNMSTPKKEPLCDFLVVCDFTNPQAIARALLPFQNRLLAITCRSESNIARFIQVIPHVSYLRTPSTESLRWATDKYEMRRRFRLYDKKRALKFTLIKNATKKEVKRVGEKVGFPMIVKPTNLAQSQLVSICYHEEELEKTLKTTFRKIQSAYLNDKRIEVPKIMAEEYMEGDMYSIDSYVNSRGKTYHCPLVRVKTGRDIGHDDFYNHLRITPTRLRGEAVTRAQEAAEMAIRALALRSTTTHTELMKIDDDWRVIEVGPRIGGFRHKLHELSCDINHSLNDVLIRIPKKPVLPKKCKGFAATLRYYPNKEGYIESLTGIKKIRDLQSFHDLDVKLKVGDKVLYSKNGGKGIFDLTLYNVERHKLLADLRRVEKLVQVKVSNRPVKKPK